MQIMPPMKSAMKVYKEKCEYSELMLKINKKQEIAPSISYSMMHALEEDFIIMMYSCTHCTIMWNCCIHRKHAVRLILSKGIVAMWHESLYHSEVKSIQTPTGLCKPDLGIFMYIWYFIANNQRNRNAGTTDGVSREYGEYLHRNNFYIYMCKTVYDEVCEYHDYTEEETVIDCRVASTSSYNQAGETIIGDLSIYGWLVMRALTIDRCTETEINNISTKGPGTKGTWKLIELSVKIIK